MYIVVVSQENSKNQQNLIILGQIWYLYLEVYSTSCLLVFLPKPVELNTAIPKNSGIVKYLS